MAETEPVTVVVTRIIKPGCEDAFRTWANDVRRVVAEYPGYLGLTLHMPRGGENQWVIGYAFDTGANLDAWIASDERARWVTKAEEFTEGGYTHAAFSGMEPFFAVPGAVDVPSPPPKWKMALTTAAAVWPVSQIIGYATAKAFPELSSPF
ncbi:MAG TPA: antibiotic biosynthesis monooxygenase, partial [Longimicrobiales bacterium]|nr:antibiotic biosynthesis monooxygenase [Longimicrobiales bacterium]